MKLYISDEADEAQTKYKNTSTKSKHLHCLLMSILSFQ